MAALNKTLQGKLKDLHHALNIVKGTKSKLAIANTKMPFANGPTITKPKTQNLIIVRLPKRQKLIHADLSITNTSESIQREPSL